ncbi:MAG: chromosome segregation protein SMC [Phycisphaera sp. TMED24]|nr:MAG: chromosome segregation protein SMC [Phycisphaera sp. TMED24]
MRLERLTLSGFKSFADATEVRFDAPINGIVGPNGCGKSNVVDALKWVLGERSAKSLRGGSMLDVIFAGAHARSPSDLAKVELVFSNPIVSRDENGQPKRELPIDTEEVSIGRALDRDNNSRYLINGAKAKAKDIRELLYGTGMGKGGYAMIEQGQVAAMLQAKPEERRRILEEAAGISGFRDRRQESSRSLERSESKLEVFRASLASTERRLKTIRNQAERARRYQVLESERVDLQRHLLTETFLRLESELNEAIQRRREAAAEGAVWLAALEQSEVDLTVKKQGETEAWQQRRKAEQSQSKAEAEHAAAAEALRAAEERYESATKANAEDQRELEELDARESGLKVERENNDRLNHEASSQLDKTRVTLDVAVAARTRTRQMAVDAERQAIRAEEAVTETQQEAERRRSEAAASEARREGTREQEEAANERLQNLREETATVAQKLELARGSFSAAERVKILAEENTSIQAATLSSLGEQQSLLASNLSEIRAAEARIQSRLDALVELRQSREGLAEGVRKVLERPEAHPGLIGVLAELIETDADSADRLELALGEHAQTLVFDSRQAAQQASDRLADAPGRVKIASLEPQGSNISPRSSGSRPSVLDGIRISGPGAWLTTRILQFTYPATNLQDAKQQSRRLREARFLLDNGTVLETDGRIVVGRESSAAGTIVRRAEERQLQEELDELLVRQLRLNENLAGVQAGEQEARQNLEDANLKEREAREALNNLQAQIDREEADQRRLRTETESAEQTCASMAARSKQFTMLAEEARERAQVAEDRLGTLRSARDEARALLELHRKDDTAAEKAVDDAHEAHREAATHAEAARRTLAATARELDESIKRRQIWLERRERRQAEQKHSEESRNANQDRLNLAESIVEKRRSESTEANQHAEAAVAARQEAESAREIPRNGSIDAEKELQHVEGLLARIALEREHLQESIRTEETFQLEDIAASAAEFKPTSSDDSDRASREERLETVRKEIRALGHINLDAIQEEQELDENNEKLIEQVADLESTIVRLTELIERLDTESRTMFGDAFERIRDHFAGDDGMFRQLFGGGSAQLELVPTESGDIDLLESGIEIRATPPGKRPRVLSQLSGGEKTMTAVALVMSIFRSNPSPVCVLDEVDAALDEANVARFCKTIQSFTDRSQFVVITHRKLTMRSCQRLYGVTMQERGVSKLVGVRVDDIQETKQGDVALIETLPTSTAQPV